MTLPYQLLVADNVSRHRGEKHPLERKISLSKQKF